MSDRSANRGWRNSARGEPTSHEAALDDGVIDAPPHSSPPSPVILIMGPSGAGKTTVGRALAVALGWEFIEADDLHPSANIAKMRAGIGLSEEDRRPWLRVVRLAIDDAVRAHTPVVVACSALKRTHRETLTEGLANARVVYLRTDASVLRQRLATRPAHFAGPRLVSTQLHDLEEPGIEVLTLDATAPLDSIVTAIRHEWAL